MGRSAYGGSLKRKGAPSNVKDRSAPRARDKRASHAEQARRVDVLTSATTESEPIVLPVNDPGALAERCWDAGFSVRVGNDETDDATVSVIDPFGRCIELVP